MRAGIASVFTTACRLTRARQFLLAPLFRPPAPALPPSLPYRSVSGSAPLLFGLFSGDDRQPGSSASSSSASTRDERTRVVNVKEAAASAPAKKLGSSTDARSPSAAFQGLSDAEYFSPSRPLRWLVAMDFSVNAWRALKAAKQLLRRDRGDSLVVFSVPVLPFMDAGNDSALYHGVDVVREAQERCIAQMAAVHEECSDLQGAYSCEVAEPASDPREIVLMRLERQRAEGRIDYAVCGQRGRSRLLNILLGSVAIHLAHYSPTSVVMVK